MKKTLLALLLFTLPLAAFSMKEQLSKGKVGDFIVSERDKRKELLRIHTIDEESFILEEIAFPSHIKKSGTKAWEGWLEEGAPGHTSWTLLEVSRTSDELLECFSFTRNAWLEIHENDLLFLKILPLPLKEVGQDERRRIGPPPKEGRDYRKIWNPPLIFDGQKKNKAPCKVYSFRFPKCASPVSEKLFELYYDEGHLEFPFPYLIRVTDESNASYNIRVIDSGRDLKAKMLELPRRSLFFTRGKEVTSEGIFLHLNIPSYYKNITLHAIDHHTHTLIELPFERREEGKSTTLFISKEELAKTLTPKTEYSFKVSSKAPIFSAAETAETFLFEGQKPVEE